MTAIPNRKLGQSELEISALGLGTWQFSQGSGLVGKWWSVLDHAAIEEIVKISLEGGINWFDTAEAYGGGKSEEALAEALNALGEEANEALIATKWWPLMRTAGSLTKTIDERLTALRGRAIDLYQVHQPYSLSSETAEMKKMATLIREKKIRYAGVSNFSAKKMWRAHRELEKEGFPLVSNQVKYSLLDRRIEHNGILNTAKELGITIIAYSPLEQGILTGKFHKDEQLIKNVSPLRKMTSSFKASSLKRTLPLIDLLDRLALEYEASPSQIALNWLVTFHNETVVAIPGASKHSHAQENIGTLSFQLSQKHLQEIDQVSREVALK
ncbi:aldo/keto reductase [Fictibacillus macauensis ZFHKF-1]|uniref:Aldo/keto reductase n=1 Tax=Fictibacillus macauensis ZFHKF-1 TaxID=1196324 RepID=I8UA58_9BACL|nr:aldo/keto reductase [Fictibacillus macauensis]EIT83673.1 aldo/keto reductase [Fictibacillus macauensis ZFHKF-1]